MDSDFSRNFKMEIPVGANYLKFVNTTKSTIFTAKTSQRLYYQGKFLFMWPFHWEEEDLGPLIDSLTDEVMEFEKTRIPKDAINCVYTKNSVIFTLYTIPRSWYMDVISSHNSSGSAKARLLLHCKIMHLLFQTDDVTENMLGTELQATYDHACGILSGNIFKLKFSSLKEIHSDSDFKFICRHTPLMGKFMELWLECALELRDVYQMSCESSAWLGRWIRYLFEAQHYCGFEKNHHLLNLSLRNRLRNVTGGTSILLELMFIMEKFEVPRSIRDNIYWDRCYYLASYLVVKSNDIIGLEKEWSEQAEKGFLVDNGVMIYVQAMGITFEDSLKLNLKEHDQALLEFRQTVMFLRNNQGVLDDLSDKEFFIFFKTLDIMCGLVARNIQGQIAMSRYGGIDYSMETVIKEIVL